MAVLARGCALSGDGSARRANQFTFVSSSSPALFAKTFSFSPARSRSLAKLCICDKLARRAKFRFAADPNHQYIHWVPSHSEGRLAIVTNAGRDAVDAAASGGKRGCRVGASGLSG